MDENTKPQDGAADDAAMIPGQDAAATPAEPVVNDSTEEKPEEAAA